MLGPSQPPVTDRSQHSDACVPAHAHHATHAIRPLAGLKLPTSSLLEAIQPPTLPTAAPTTMSSSPPLIPGANAAAASAQRQLLALPSILGSSGDVHVLTRKTSRQLLNEPIRVPDLIGNTSQSSTVDGGMSSHAIDGNTSSCTHTKEENQPWWKHTFSIPVEIERVEVWNDEIENERLKGALNPTPAL